MLRGQFIRGDGLVIPNNVTTYGVKSFFRWALRNEDYSLHMGLASCAPNVLLQVEDLNEPTIGQGGYLRQAITRATDWPVFGLFNGEQYYETSLFVFTATGDGFDKPINRLALINSETDVVGEKVVALSGPLPAELTILPTTPEELRTFKYRIYGR
jgi:hypothetical protein